MENILDLRFAVDCPVCDECKGKLTFYTANAMTVDSYKAEYLLEHESFDLSYARGMKCIPQINEAINHLNVSHERGVAYLTAEEIDSSEDKSFYYRNEEEMEGWLPEMAAQGVWEYIPEFARHLLFLNPNNEVGKAYLDRATGTSARRLRKYLVIYAAVGSLVALAGVILLFEIDGFVEIADLVIGISWIGLIGISIWVIGQFWKWRLLSRAAKAFMIVLSVSLSAFFIVQTHPTNYEIKWWCKANIPGCTTQEIRGVTEVEAIEILNEALRQTPAYPSGNPYVGAFASFDDTNCYDSHGGDNAYYLVEPFTAKVHLKGVADVDGFKINLSERRPGEIHTSSEGGLGSISTHRKNWMVYFSPIA